MKALFGKKYVYLLGVLGNLTGMMAGSALTWSSSQLIKLSENEDNPLGRKITDDESSWLGSLPNIGGILGPFIFAFLAQNFGRKISITALGLPFLLCYIFIASSKVIALYYVGRILAGMGVGGCFTILPMYLGEIATDANRGLLTSSTTSFVICGILFAYCVGPYTSILWFNLILMIFPAVFMVFFLIAAESPYYYLSRNREVEAREALKKLRAEDNVDEEFDRIKNNLSQGESGGFLDIFRSKAATRAFITCFTITVLQQFSGINVLLAYTQDIFKSTGSNLDSAISSIIIGGVQFASCYFTPVGSKRFTRRTMFLFSLAGITVTLVLLGLFFFLDSQGKAENISWLPLVAMVAFFLFYNSGEGALPWTLMSEMFPLNVKSVACAVITGVYWLVGFVLTYTFNSMAEGMGRGPSFWLYAGFAAFNWFFVYFYLIETKGKSFNQIQEELGR